MDPSPLLPTDCRDPVNDIIRQWLEKITGFPIPPLVKPYPPPYKWDKLFYGDLGDHRAQELTVLSMSPVLVPARKTIYPSMQPELLRIDCTTPTELRALDISNDLTARATAVDKLSSGQPVLFQREVPFLLRHLRLNPGNIAANALAGPKDMIDLADGAWAKASLSPSVYQRSWEQFLALGAHPGAFVWTEITHVGQVARPTVVEYLDGCKRGIVTALAETIGGSLSVRTWRQRSDIGHHLVHLLLWLDPGTVTEDDIQFRKAAIDERNWDGCIYRNQHSRSQCDDPVSAWFRYVASPGSLLLIPPGTFVMEYSSGAAAATEGRFLPWACVPMLREVGASPDLSILKSMMYEGEDALGSGDVTVLQIRALAALIDGKKIGISKSMEKYRKKIEGFEREVQIFCNKIRE